MKAISYARVSTTVQGESGLGLDDQLAKCQDYAARNGLEVLDHVVEVESAKSVAGRPLLTSTLERLRRGEADTLIVAKLDRLSRSVLDLCQLMEKADREGWTLVVIDLGVDSSPSGRLQAHVVGAFAEYERRLIGQRTRDAMSAAKARGVQWTHVEPLVRHRRARRRGASLRAHLAGHRGRPELGGRSDVAG